MQIDIYKCSSCFQDYDLDLHTPKVLNSCFHYLCLKCLQNLLQDASSSRTLDCPICKQGFQPSYSTAEGFPTDSTLLELVANRTKTKTEGCCEKHDDCEQNLFCMKDQVPICKGCAQSREHKGHKIVSLRTLKDDLMVKKKRRLEQLMEDDTNKRRKTEKEMSDMSRNLKEMVKNKFVQMREILNKRETELNRNIENTAQAEKEALVNKYRNAKNRLKEKMTELPSNESSESLLAFIKKELTQNNNNFDKDFALSEGKEKENFEGICRETTEILAKIPKIISSLEIEQKKTNDIVLQRVDGKPVKFSQRKTSRDTDAFSEDDDADDNEIKGNEEAQSSIESSDDENEDLLALKPKIIDERRRKGYEDRIRQEDFCKKISSSQNRLKDDFDLSSPRRVKTKKKGMHFEDAADSGSDSEDLSASSGRAKPKKIQIEESWTNRLKILSDLKKAVINEVDRSLEPEKVSMSWLSENIKKVKVEQYHQILINLRCKYYDPSFAATARRKDLQEWRQKIREWLLSLKKPQHWQVWLEINDKSKVFNKRLVNVLRKMPKRNFGVLQSKVRQILQEISKEKNLYEVPMKRLCWSSCTWWYIFLRRNQDIRDLWHSLPKF